MISDLKQGWTERQLRKTAYMHPTAVMSTSINFASHPRSTTRTEFPNKYHKPNIPKIEIEQVQHLHLLKRGKSLPGSLPQSARPSTQPQVSPQRTFYYSPRNEILSIDEFFQVQKGMESFRKRKDKESFYLAMEERRQKVEDSHTERAMSAIGRSCMSLAVSPSAGSMSMRKDHNLSISNGRMISSFMVKGFSPRVSANKEENVEKVTNQENKKEKRRVVLKPRRQEFPEKEFLSMFEIKKRSGSMSCRGFTSRQKFTDKEINKHLVVGTVTPRPMKYGGKAVQKEKAFVTMFKDPRVMDLQVEGTIRKAKKMLDEEKSHRTLRRESPEEEASRRECWSARSKDIMTGRELSRVKSAISEVYSNEVDGALLAKKIQDNIKSINQVLSTTTPRLLAGSANYPSRYDQRKRLKKRIPLRSEVEAKYNLFEHIRQHKELSRKMKDVGKAMKKDVGQAGINNQTYVNFYA